MVVCNKKKHEECNKFQSNFLALQRHFLDGAISSLQQVDKDVQNEKEFLGVTDISKTEEQENRRRTERR